MSIDAIARAAEERARERGATLRRLLAELSPFRGELTLALVLVLVGATTQAAGPWLISRAIDHEPALAFRDRAAFLDPHRVAGPVAVVGVVRSVFFRARHELLVQRVHDPALDAHDHGLVTGVADHDSLQNAFRHPLTLPATPGGAARREWF